MIFLSGVLGSAHCVGMCGGFALTLGSGAPNIVGNLCRQSVYSLGRLFTYSVCGAAAGYAGASVNGLLRPLADAGVLLSIVAGGLLVVLGLSAAGVLGRFGVAANTSACLPASFFGSFLNRPRLVNVFLAGLFNGFLPCGLVYAYLALAAASRHMLEGAAIMLLFGLGTIPLMIATGCGAGLLPVMFRRHAFRVAAWCVVATGLLSVARSFGFAHLPGFFDGPGCPMCR